MLALYIVLLWVLNMSIDHTLTSIIDRHIIDVLGSFASDMEFVSILVQRDWTFHLCSSFSRSVTNDASLSVSDDSSAFAIIVSAAVWPVWIVPLLMWVTILS